MEHFVRINLTPGVFSRRWCGLKNQCRLRIRKSQLTPTHVIKNQTAIVQQQGCVQVMFRELWSCLQAGYTQTGNIPKPPNATIVVLSKFRVMYSFCEKSLQDWVMVWFIPIVRKFIYFIYRRSGCSQMPGKQVPINWRQSLSLQWRIYFLAGSTVGSDPDLVERLQRENSELRQRVFGRASPAKHPMAVHVRCNYMYLLKVHPRPEEAKLWMTIHSEKEE